MVRSDSVAGRLLAACLDAAEEFQSWCARMEQM